MIRDNGTRIIQAAVVRDERLDDALINVLYRDGHIWDDSPRRIGGSTANITGVRVLRK